MESLFDVAKRLADMIHKNYMTAIFEVHAPKPGVAFDGSRMVAWDPEMIGPGPNSVACAAELGLRELQTPSTPEDYLITERLDAASGKVLIKPIVLL